MIKKTRTGWRRIVTIPRVVTLLGLALWYWLDPSNAKAGWELIRDLSIYLSSPLVGLVKQAAPESYVAIGVGSVFAAALTVWAQRTGRRRNRWALLSSAGAFVAVLVFLWNYNGLVSDEELIAHFQEHRAEYEDLIWRYRNFERRPGIAGWSTDPEIKALADKIKVTYIANIGSLWLPNPYSQESAERIEASKHPCSGCENYWRLMDKYGTQAMTTNIGPSEYFLPSEGPLRKEIIHIPEIPIVEGGRIKPPAKAWRLNKAPKAVPTKREGAMLLPSLNSVPSELGQRACAYREIEPHWYIALCRR